MTEPTSGSAVASFADLPAIEPPVPALLALRVESMVPTLVRDARVSLIDSHYRSAGEEHADLLTERLVDARLAPSSRRALDAGAAALAYERASRQTNQSGEQILQQQHYVAGLCEQLADQATRYEEAIATARASGHSDLRALDLGRSVSTAGLSLEDVSALAEEMRDFARWLAATAVVQVPALRAHDEFATERQRTREAADRLAILIDRLAVLTALPQLDRSQVAGRKISDTSLVAAQIGRIQAEMPSAIALLDHDRTKILSIVVPDATWHDQRRPASPESPTRLPSDLHRTADRLLHRLSHPAAPLGEPAEAEQTARAEMSRAIAKLHAENPEIVSTLPPVHAGLVREVVAAVNDAAAPAPKTGKPKLALVQPHIEADRTMPAGPSRPRR